VLLMYRRGVKECYVGVAKDLSGLDEEAFWAAMSAQRLLWQHTHQGQPVDLGAMRQLLPTDVSGECRAQQGCVVEGEGRRGRRPTCVERSSER
jgi:hypothetical protein